MKVADFTDQAGKRLVTVGPEQGVRAIAHELDQPGIDLVVVVGTDGKMLGVVTDSDIVSWAAGNEPAGDTTAAALMSKDVYSCTAGQVLNVVVGQAVNRRLKHFPILDDGGRPLGVVYVSDALIALHKDDQLSPETLLEYVHGGGYR
jgi:signal-transduction protein with cAMP-binding, CBS, and nucleotidyltransferase domain